MKNFMKNYLLQFLIGAAAVAGLADKEKGG